MSSDQINKDLNNLLSMLDNTEKKKLLFCVPESAGDIFLSTSLLEDLKETYYDYDIYFACKEQYKDILLNNPFIYKWIPYMTIMEQSRLMEGFGEWGGVFDISILPVILTQRYFYYIHNGSTRLSINLKE